MQGHPELVYMQRATPAGAQPRRRSTMTESACETQGTSTMYKQQATYD
jgi:hypothetical protein